MKFNKLDDQTNIDNSCKYYRISYYINLNLTTNHYYKLLWSSESFEVKYNIGTGIPIEFPNKREKTYSNRSINNKLDYCGPVSHLR